MILVTLPRPWVDSAAHGGNVGSADMRIGLLSTLRDETLALPVFQIA